MAIKAKPYSSKELFGSNRQPVYRGETLLQIAMPLGGIGTGSVCLNGYGGIQDFSIRNRPELTALPDGHNGTEAAFGVLHFPKKGIARLLEGPFPKGKIYDQGLKSQGYRGGGHEGLPRFRNCSFQGEYPFGKVDLSDPAIDLEVEIKGYNPFIPLDDKNSSIPCAILEYTFINRTAEVVDFRFSYHMTHLAQDDQSSGPDSSRNEVISNAGVYFFNLENPTSEKFGSAALGVIGHEARVKGMWFRGAWFDSTSVLWRELETGKFSPNDGSAAPTASGRNGGSILLEGSLQPGDRITYPVVLCWYFPNVEYSYCNAAAGPAAGCECSSGDCNCLPWQPYYATQWGDAREVFTYVSENYLELRKRTQAFHDALFSTTLPAYVMGAVSANLAILKSPTVLRQANKNFWGWEGCFPDRGCCPGSCTHVWNYAQSMAHLFPALERTLREQELERSMNAEGQVDFRAALPDGPNRHEFPAASDGQLGGIMKVYREWQISGDRSWLERLYPAAKRSLEYCIRTWDPHRKGVLEEPHHNTYDIEFWGPDGMCSGFYLGALLAMAKMAEAMGEPITKAGCEKLAKKCARYLEQYLFNGEYFQQKVVWRGLEASLNQDQLQAMRFRNPEEAQMYDAEGPKYQYGSGCISDSLFGIFLADLNGLVSPLRREYVLSTLDAIFGYNFKHSLWEHANLQRPGYALGDEPGLLLCSWPKGNKPTLPFVYSDEVWTGIEYQVAAHLIREGKVAEGLTIVKALRSRYDGSTRNPWNEYECGSYYARAMASYALLAAFSGFRYSAVERTLYLKPWGSQWPLRTFFSTASGWGTLTLTENQLRIDLREGFLDLNELKLTFPGKAEINLLPNVMARARKTSIINLLGGNNSTARIA